MNLMHKELMRFLLLCTALLMLTLTIHGQVTDSIAAKKDYLPFDSVIRQLERKYNIAFFYEPLWFQDVTISSSFADMPLPEAIASIKQLTQLSILKINEINYVFLPASGNDNDNSESDGKYVVVGDLLSYGSKNKVNLSALVVDATNEMPLHGATISFPDLKKTVITDIEGKISLSLPVGVHEMLVTFPGYLENKKDLKVLSDGHLTVEMFDKTIELSDVVVTANKIDQNFRRTQMSIVKMQGKAIRELPNTLGEVDIIKSLSLLPGVTTAGEFGSGFNVRGGSSDQNLVLVEDVPVFNSAHLFGLVSILNADAITSVTLYKGGIPASFGERVSSVLNVTLGSEDLTKTRVKAGISLINSHLNIEVPVGKKITVMVGGRTTYSDWMLKKIPDADLMNSSAGFNDLYGLLSFTPNAKNKISLFAYSSNDRFRFAGTQNYSYGNLLGSLRMMHRFTNKLFTTLTLGSSYYKATYTENDTIRPLEAYSTENSILYRTLKWNLIWEMNDKHVITGGINAFLYNVNPGIMSPYGKYSQVPSLKMQDEQGMEWAAFLSDDIKFSDKISCEVGFRYSAFDNLGPKKVWIYDPSQPKTVESVIDSVLYKKGQVVKAFSGFEPRLSFRYNFSEHSSIRLTYNRINQYINLISNTSVLTPSSIWKLSDAYIRPVSSNQFAFGYFRDFRKNRYETSIEVYYKTYSNLIEYKNGAHVLLDPQIETQLIDAVGRNYGVEVFLKKNTGKLTGWLSYTYSHSMRKTSSSWAVEKINNNHWFPDNLDRPHNLVLNSGYYFNRRVRLGVTYTYNTGRPVTLPELKYFVDGYQIVYYSDRNKYRMPDYSRLDLSISRYENLRIKKKWKGYWTISIMNVLGRKNAYSIFYQKDVNPNNLNQPSYSLYKLYIIGRPLPTFTYNITF